MKKLHIWLLVAALLIQTVSPAAFAEIDVDIPVPEFRAALLDIGNMENLNAYENGVQLLLNTQYEDISDNPFERNIIRMAAQGIAGRQGNENFSPENEITGFETMRYLVRLAGGEAAVEAAVLPLTGGLSEDSIQALYNQQYAAQAIGLGILLQNEYKDMQLPATREQIGVWLSRTIGVAPVATDIAGVYGFNDYALVTPSNRGIIEALLRQEIMNSGNDGNFNPSGSMSRGEFMEVIDAGSELLYATNNIVTNYGLVTGVQEATTNEVGYTLNERTLIVRNVDGSVTGIKTDVNTSNNQKMDFVLYKNNMPFSSKGVLVGDEIQYFTKNGAVIYVEAINDNTILEKIKLSEAENGNLTTYFGNIYDVLDQKYWNEDHYVDSKRYRVRTFDGQTFDLVVETDLYTGISNDMIVYKDNIIGGIELLEEGDDISFVVKDNDSVVYVTAIPLWETDVSGTVRYLTTDEDTGLSRITIFGYDDVIYEYPIAPYVNVTINDNYGQIDDLLYGQDVTLELKNGYVIDIDSETFVENPGYIPKYGKVRMGTIYAVYPAGIVFDIAGKKLSYDMPSGIPITKGGVAITRNALREGDSVKLFFDDIYTDQISKMEVEGIERLIQQVYKGKLGSVNETKQTITIYEPRYLKNDDWIDTETYSEELTLSDGAEIYDGNLPIDVNELERIHRNQTVYVVVEDSYGDSVASKVSVKYGGENVFSDTIYDIDDAIGGIELEEPRINFNITKGTIVVKDSRFIDSSLLSKKDNVLIVSQYSDGVYDANVIKLMTRTESIFERVYIGAIEGVGGNYFTLRNWSTMDDNEWDDVDDSTSDRMYYHTDTIITDITDSDDPDTIKPADFFYKSYARLENEGTDDEGLEYERYYAIVVLEDTEDSTASYQSVAAVNMRHKGLLEDQNIDDDLTSRDDIDEELDDTLDGMYLTRGIVEEVDDTWDRIRLTDSNDWISSVAEWRSNSVDTYVEYPNAIVMNGNEVISVDDITVGDSISVLRNDEKALVIFVDEE